MISAGPGLVQSRSALTATPPLPNGQRLLFFDIPRRICRVTTEIAQCLHTASAVLNTRCAPPTATPRLLRLRRIYHSFSAGLPPKRLIKLRLRDRLCISIRGGHPLIMPNSSYQICRLINQNTRPCIDAKNQVFQKLFIPSERIAGRRYDNPLHTHKAKD